jgi:cyanophycinase-like exopeptidase
MAELEGELISGRAPRYVQIATAAVPDGPGVVERWHDLGRRQADRLGVEAVVLPIETRAQADDEHIASQVTGAGLVYLSGGHPDYLADTLRGTATWTAIEAAWRAGAALAGCSAGAMAMSQWIPSWRHPERNGTEGMGILPHLRVIPHFDRFFARAPELLGAFRGRHDDVHVVGVDEETAIVGDTHTFTVWGRGSAWLLQAEGRAEYPAGSVLTL